MTEIATTTPPTTAAAANFDAFFEQRSDQPVRFYILKIFLDGLMDEIKSINHAIYKVNRLVAGTNVRTLELRVMGFEARVAAAESRAANLEHDVNGLTSKALKSTGTDAAHVRDQERIGALEKRVAELEARDLEREKRVAELESRPGLKYLGVFQQNTLYREGDALTDHGNIYIARRTTATRPGVGDAHSADWTLACKKGRDGEDLR